MSKGSPKHRLGRIRSRARNETQRPVPALVQAYLQGTPTRTDEPASTEAGDDRRRARRVSLNSEVTVRRIGGFNFLVALSNLSAGGCNVELIEEAEVGDSVIARFPQLEPLGSRVRWVDGRTSGIEFHNALHPAVFDVLVTRLPGNEPAAAA